MRFLEGDGLGGDHVHQRAALQAREDGAVDRLLVLRLHQDDAAARAAQALVGGRSHDVGVRHRVGVHARGDQAGVVGHVDHEDRADVLGDLGEAFEVDAQRIGRGARDDQLGHVLVRLALHRVVVDGFVGVQAVAHDVEPLAAHVERHAVGQVAAFGQAHAHDGVAGLQEGQQHGFVGRGAAMRLHIGGVGAEELLHAVDRQLLGDVDVLAAAVVALARVALGVLVGELRALGGHDGRGSVVLARDQLDVVFLARGSRPGWQPRFRDRLFDEDVAVVHGSPLRRVSLFFNQTRAAQANG
jgi:hypothetical protein